MNTAQVMVGAVVGSLVGAGLCVLIIAIYERRR